MHNYATLSYFMTVHTVSVTIKGCMNTNRFLPLVEPTGLAVSLPKWPRLSGIADISQRSTQAPQFVLGPVKHKMMIFLSLLWWLIDISG